MPSMGEYTRVAKALKGKHAFQRNVSRGDVPREPLCPPAPTMSGKPKASCLNGKFRSDSVEL